MKVGSSTNSDMLNLMLIFKFLIIGNWTNPNILNLIVMFNLFVLDQKTHLLGKYGRENQNCLFKMKFNT